MFFHKNVYVIIFHFNKIVQFLFKEKIKSHRTNSSALYYKKDPDNLKIMKNNHVQINEYKYVYNFAEFFYYPPRFSLFLL